MATPTFRSSVKASSCRFSSESVGSHAHFPRKIFLAKAFAHNSGKFVEIFPMNTLVSAVPPLAVSS
jgi:hypothetical protein